MEKAFTIAKAQLLRNDCAAVMLKSLTSNSSESQNLSRISVDTYVMRMIIIFELSTTGQNCYIHIYTNKAIRFKV